MADEKKKETKGQAKGAAKPTEKKIKPYAQHKMCPKCGPGYHLAEHKDRRSCGKCGYFEKK